MSSSSTVMVGGVPADMSELDLNDLSSNAGNVRTANITLIVLVGLFVGLRLFVRAYMIQKIFLDDILILVAAAFTIALASVCLLATVHGGLGTHIWLFPTATMFDTVKSCIQYLFVCQVLYACAIAFTKIAIIASYLRFVQDRKFRIFMYATAVVIVGLWFTGVFVTIFQCRPVSGAWDFSNQARSCLDFVNYLYASSAVTVTTDIILCALPWPYLWKLHMPLKQRIILCLLFGGGAGACVASIVRIANLHTLRSLDVTYQCVPCLNLSVTECSLGIICVSIPPLRPLAVRLFPKALRSNRSTSIKSPFHSISLNNHSARSDNNAGSQAKNQRDQDLYAEDDLNEEWESCGRPTSDAPVLQKEDMTMNS